MRLKKLFFGAVATALLVPSLVFGASVNVNLKDLQGNSFTDLSGVTVKLLDSTGNVVNEVSAPTEATVTFQNLISAESYIIVTQYSKTDSVPQNDSVTVVSSQTKTLRFADDQEILNKDFFISNPFAQNVSLRLTRLPADWTGAKVKLTPVETSRFQVSADNLVFNLTPSNGQAQMDISKIPAGRYNWQVSDADENNITIGDNARTVRTNGTLTFNLEAVKPQVVNFTFKLLNPDRSPANFNGETISVAIKNSEGSVVWSDSITANGESASISSSTLQNGSYTIEATMSSSAEVPRTATRAILLSGTPRNTNINFTKLDSVTISFLVRDSRTSQGLNGTIKVYKSDGTTLLDTINVENGSASRSFVYGYPYKLEISAEGHSSRTMNLTPRQNQVREINLFAI